MIIAEQLPAKLVQGAVNNTNLKIMHWLTAEGDRCYLGETMLLDDAQLKFATWLRADEALTYRDEFAEATHISIPRTLTAAAPAGWPGHGHRLAALGHLRPVPCPVRLSWAALAMVGDPTVVSKIKDAVVVLRSRVPSARRSNPAGSNWSAGCTPG